MTRQTTATKALTRFLAKVDKTGPDGCWRWTGSKSESGYGRVCVARHMYQAHRWAYEHFVGPIPDGLQLDHLCRVRSCVNPDHLEPVTAYENVMRSESWAAQNTRKTSCPRGHLYDDANTYVRPGGGRDCRACRREVMRNRRRKEADPAAADRAGHGKAATYRDLKCRCDACRAANSADVAAYKARRRERETLSQAGESS